MIQGIGIDITNIARFKNQKNKKMFLENYLNDEEILQVDILNDKTHSCAVIFALKEAVMKAFKVGLNSGVNFRDIRINKDFTVNLRGIINKINKGKKEILISKTSSKKYALGLALIGK